MKKLAVRVGRAIIGICWIVSLVLAFFAPTWWRHAHFYPSSLSRYAPPGAPVPDLNMPSLDEGRPARAIRDQPELLSRRGMVLVDLAHANRFDLIDVSVLLSRVTARGAQIEYLEDTLALPTKLRSAQSVILALPDEPYADWEITELRRFVERGGKLLLIAEPTKAQVSRDGSEVWGDARYLNRLAGAFGAFFADDYLYNLVSNDGNFQRVFARGFLVGPLTEGLTTVTFHIAHSILGDVEPVMWGDSNTLSSSREPAGRLAPVALAAGGQVLFLGDLTILTEPTNTLYDNDRFVSNLATFLAQSSRTYSINDFPLFLEREVLFHYLHSDMLQPEVLSAGGLLQATLQASGRTLEMVDFVPSISDSIVIGRYQEAGSVAGLLEQHGVELRFQGALDSSLTTADGREVTPEDLIRAGLLRSGSVPAFPPPSSSPRGVLEIEGMGALNMAGTALILLHQTPSASTLLILSDTREGLSEMLGRLTMGQLGLCLSHGDLTFCSTQTAASYGEIGGGVGGYSMPTEPEPEPLEEATPELAP